MGITEGSVQFAESDVMTRLPAKAEDLRTRAINISGIPFARDCEKRLASSGWKILAREHPVAYRQPIETGPPNESCLDILATYDPHPDRVDGIFHRSTLARNDTSLNCVIECKKAHPEMKEWIFFRSAIRKRLFFPLLLNNTDELPETPQRNFSTEVKCDNAIELKGDWHDEKNSTKTGTARIQEACYQVNLACQALCTNQKHDLRALRGISTSKHLVVPTIITTANLLVADESASQVDHRTGETDRLDYKEVDFVIYECPLTSRLQFYISDRSRPLDVNRIHHLTSRDILIINSQNMEKTLSILADTVIQ